MIPTVPNSGELLRAQILSVEQLCTALRNYLCLLDAIRKLAEQAGSDPIAKLFEAVIFPDLEAQLDAYDRDLQNIQAQLDKIAGGES